MRFTDTQKQLVTDSGIRGLNPYWEGLLGKEEKLIVEGYSWACRDVENALGSKGMEYTDMPSDTLKKIITEIDEDTKDMVGTYMEVSRNELIVSLIDGMDDDEYAKRYEEELQKIRKALDDNDIADFS